MACQVSFGQVRVLVMSLKTHTHTNTDIPVITRKEHDCDLNGIWSSPETQCNTELDLVDRLSLYIYIHGCMFAYMQAH